MSLLFNPQSRTATLHSESMPWHAPFTTHRRYLLAKVQNKIENSKFSSSECRAKFTLALLSREKNSMKSKLSHKNIQKNSTHLAMGGVRTAHP